MPWSFSRTERGPFRGPLSHIRLGALRVGELSRRGLAALVGQLEAELLAFRQAAHAGAFDGADMDEYVLRSVVRLDETVALLGVEPLNSAYGHGGPRLDESIRRAKHSHDEKAVALFGYLMSA